MASVHPKVKMPSCGTVVAGRRPQGAGQWQGGWRHPGPFGSGRLSSWGAQLFTLGAGRCDGASTPNDALRLWENTYRGSVRVSTGALARVGKGLHVG